MSYFPLLMFPLLLLLLVIGVPVAFSMLAVAVGFGAIIFGDSLHYQLVTIIEHAASNYILAAVTLFVFMGCMLERANIAGKLFEAAHMWTRRLPGGLAIGTILICIIFAAATGVVGATETVVGLLAVPVMLKHKYNKGLISGTVCAGGSLGTIIPPSVVPVLMGPLANVSVADLLVAMVFPGLIMAGLYITYILVRAIIQPSFAPIEKDMEPVSLEEKLKVTLYSLLPPLVLIFAVLGSIMMGVASPTEAAAIGALGAVLLSIVYGQFSLAALHGALINTIKITAMIMTILLAGTMLTDEFIAAGGGMLTNDIISSLDVDRWMLLVAILGVAFVLGVFLDWISIVLIMIPLFVPVVTMIGFDPIWFCILFLIVIQTSYITPPMAPAIFYLRGIAPPEIRTMDMYKGVMPFIALQIITLMIVMAFPQVALWLPSQLLGFN